LAETGTIIPEKVDYSLHRADLTEVGTVRN
jgi:hypothetical protein